MSLFRFGFICIILKCIVIYRRALLLVLIVLNSNTIQAQLTDFTLTVTPVHETCLGNGALTFTVANTTPGTSMLYTVYKLPNLTTPISVSAATSLSSLTGGSYRIIATQSLGALSNEQQQDAIIENHIAALEYEVTATNQNCAAGAQLIITGTSGTPSEYEIINGPVTIPRQDSNTLGPLPAGVYVIRVFDECGQAEVTTYTLQLNNDAPAISDPVYDSSTSADCNTVTVTNTIAYEEGVAISYPLTITYTLIPADGSPPTIIERVFDSGDTVELSVIEEFPVGAAAYTYTMTIADGCSVFERTGMVIDPAPAISYELVPILPCGDQYLSLAISQFTPPYIVDFSSVTDPDFDPSLFNEIHPGPFTEDSVTYGSDENPVPEGDYIVQVTDACGRSTSIPVHVEKEIPQVIARGRNDGCFSDFGRITVSVPDRDLVYAIIISGPPPQVEGEVVTGFIDGGGRLVLLNKPVGFYVITVRDECGQLYENITVEIPEFEEQDFNAVAISDCTEGSGAVKIVSGNGRLESMVMVEAENGLFDTPIDVSDNISTAGVFNMGGLPAGRYIFEGTDICGILKSVPIEVVPYTPSPNPFTFTPHCGSFDLTMTDTPSADTTYWLQKEMETPGTWGNPDTNMPFIEGSEPSTVNSRSLVNGQTLFNLMYEGTFRIIKFFKSVNNAGEEKICFEILGHFEYFDGARINNVYNISCYRGADDIYIDAFGVPPLHYAIDMKNGAPITFDNGENPIFSDLEPATYRFVVEDSCGYIVKKDENIGLLPELTVAHDPGIMLECTDSGITEMLFDLRSQTPAILADQSPISYTVTYHTSELDASTGDHPLPEQYTNTSNPQTIYARLVHNHIPLCHDVVAFDLRLSEYPVLDMNEDEYICTGDSEGGIFLSANEGFDSYKWSTGETVSSIYVTEPGLYWVEVGFVYGNMSCTARQDITVNPSGEPTSITVSTDDWTNDHNTITMHVTGPGDYQYSLDGIHFQPSPVFENLPTGIYTVLIDDINGCGLVAYEVVLCNYPKFFTPNGDGINDTWHIEFSWFEPEMEIYIYDRYGKLITGFQPGAPGWDGTLNGKKLPATDYWFVVNRKNGKTHRGHFAMIR